MKCYGISYQLGSLTHWLGDESVPVEQCTVLWVRETYTPGCAVILRFVVRDDRPREPNCRKKGIMTRIISS